MGAIAEAFRTGGISMYLLLALALAGSIIPLGGLILAAIKKRIPLAVLLLVPCMALIIGSFGAAIGIAEALEAIQKATPETRMKLLAYGIALTLNTKTFAGIIATFYFSASAAALGLGSIIGAGKPRQWTFASLGISVVTSALGVAGLIAMLVFSRGAGGSGASMILTALFVALGCVMVNASIHAEDEEAKARLASHRFAVGVLAMLALLTHGHVSELIGRIETFEALEMATPSNRLSMYALGTELAKQGWHMGMAGAVAAFFFGIAPAFLTAKHALDRRGMIGAAIAAFGLMLTGGAVLASSATATGGARAMGQPSQRWKVQANVKTPSINRFEHLTSVNTWDVGLVAGDERCVLHRPGGKWELTPSFEDGSVRGIGACQDNARDGRSDEGCPSAAGTLDGPLCSGMERVTTLVDRELTADELLAHPWGSEPKTIVLALDASIDHLPAEVDPAMGLLFSAAPSGLSLTILPDAPAKPTRHIIAKGDAFAIVKTDKGVVPVVDAQSLKVTLEAMPPTEGGIVVVPGKKWDMQLLTEVCIAAHLGHRDQSKNDVYDRPEASCTIARDVPSK